MEYLGFWVTRTGIRPINNKVESIVNTTPTKYKKKVCAFIGIVNYYMDMQARRPHLLHPLTALTSNQAKFKWTDMEQKVFDDIKRTLAQDILLSYPDFNKRFDIHTDDSYYQLGAVIFQDVKPISLQPQNDRTANTVYSNGKWID